MERTSSLKAEHLKMLIDNPFFSNVCFTFYIFKWLIFPWFLKNTANSILFKDQWPDATSLSIRSLNLEESRVFFCLFVLNPILAIWKTDPILDQVLPGQWTGLLVSPGINFNVLIHWWWWQMTLKKIQTVSQACCED